MEQYNDAVEKLKDLALRKQFEREQMEYGKYDFRDDSYVDDKAERRELQRHFRDIQKAHRR